MSAALMIVIVGFAGLAIDLSRIYNRKVELQSLAKAAALAAAGKLDGTPAGVDAALDAAAAVVNTFRYQYNSQPIMWTDSAVHFSKTAPHDAVWVDSAAATADATGMFFVRVDTTEFGAELSQISTMFVHILSPKFSQISVRNVAIAGRTSIDVTPLAICAMNPARAESRNNPGPPALAELVEFGFRRGVSYNLMNLNPNGTQPENFLVDPFSWPGMTGRDSNFDVARVAPFVCAGSMWVPGLRDGQINVSRKFPIDPLYHHLNTRFGQYGGTSCTYRGAPPDANIRAYVRDSAVPWMAAPPDSQSAAPTTADGMLRTVADPLPAPDGNTPGMYGPLWAYAKAVPFSAYTPNVPERASGYTTFLPSDWPTLYNKPGAPTPKNYPTPVATSTPYGGTLTGNFLAPPSPGAAFAVRHRRVLNIPLLECPVAAGSISKAKVLGIGRFFMTVPATSGELHAEFAGVLSDNAVTGKVELL